MVKKNEIAKKKRKRNVKLIYRIVERVIRKQREVRGCI